MATDVDQLIDVALFHDDIKIDRVNITDSFMNQASNFAHYAALQVKAMRQASNFKIMRDAIRAKADLEIRQRNTDKVAAELSADPKAKIERLTEGAIEAQLLSDAKVIKAIKDYNDADAILSFVSNTLEAFKQRRDMLISLGATVRQEMNGELRMQALGRANDAAVSRIAHA